MSGGLIFSEESMINGNIFKFEQRLMSHVNKYVENGAILTTYYPIRETATTVDRGTRDIDQLFGHKSPLRFNKILNFPLYGFGAANPENTDEMNVEDINVEGDAEILPATVVPSQNDCFIVNHLKMRAVFTITSVQYDSMKVEGYYKIHYRLISTSNETLENLEKQTVETFRMDLNAIGSNLNPVIKEDDFILRSQIEQMVNQMIRSYRALFYNERHNCFLYHHPKMGFDWFDLCGNEFMAKHALMNFGNSSKVIILHEKIRDKQLPVYYGNSVYNWLELGAPKRMLQKFYFMLNSTEGYRDSSFYRWGDKDVQVMQPLALYQIGINNQQYSIFDDSQFNSFDNETLIPESEYDKLIWKYINKGSSLTIHDVSLYTADALISSIRHMDTFIYTPIVIYIIREILGMN